MSIPATYPEGMTVNFPYSINNGNLAVYVTQPASITVPVVQSKCFFQVSVTGQENHYQWYKGGVAIGSQTDMGAWVGYNDPVLEVVPGLLGAGAYSLTCKAWSGTNPAVTSAAAVLTVV